MLTDAEREQLELAEAILASEPMMWLMVGSNHPDAQIGALRPAFQRWHKLSGGYRSYNGLNQRLSSIGDDSEVFTAITELIKPQWRSHDYDRNALIDDLRRVMGLTYDETEPPTEDSLNEADSNGVDPNFQCDRCNAVGKHWMEDCPN